MASKTIAFDLTDAKPEEIAKFRNLAIANVIQPMIGGDELASHDRHYSNHSKDKAISFLLTAEEVVLPAQLFSEVQGAKKLAAKDFVKRIR
ncbi:MULTISPECIES: hypothetical protein [Mesorhizobium]|uniref:Uncharacterized protein n=1 Tax=Mesorhizobium australicum TaxID=536018 RepID=A0A1X7PS28_9HYPH|nr:MULTISPECIES: hypothetical protein [Mesorhizobium]MCR5856458.1 hypothetical protein [Mesorhizobium sp. J428]SMH54834.1 hypothetical protein SAMN02982922_5231 [Mesorhizobium australicum]